MIQVEKNILQKYNYIDLFAGIGGFHLALESFGANCVFASEFGFSLQYLSNICFKADLKINTKSFYGC